jgi:hypothetical protein
MSFRVSENDHASSQTGNEKANADFRLSRPMTVRETIFTMCADLKQKLRPQGDEQSIKNLELLNERDRKMVFNLIDYLIEMEESEKETKNQKHID